MERRRTRHLKFFRIMGENRLAAIYEYSDPAAAHERMVSAVRELTFACATELRPGDWKAAFPQVALPSNSKQTRAVNVPGQDHVSVWRNADGVHIIVDEPYPSRFAETAEERQRWCETNDYEWLTPKWTGIHAPHLGAQMQIYARRGDGTRLLNRLSSILARMPTPVDANPWTGESTLLGRRAAKVEH